MSLAREVGKGPWPQHIQGVEERLARPEWWLWAGSPKKEAAGPDSWSCDNGTRGCPLHPPYLQEAPLLHGCQGLYLVVGEHPG